MRFAEVLTRDVFKYFTLIFLLRSHLEPIAVSETAQVFIFPIYHKKCFYIYQIPRIPVEVSEYQ